MDLDPYKVLNINYSNIIDNNCTYAVYYPSCFIEYCVFDNKNAEASVSANLNFDYPFAMHNSFASPYVFYGDIEFINVTNTSNVINNNFSSLCCIQEPCPKKTVDETEAVEFSIFNFTKCVIGPSLLSNDLIK